jgi:hypothetical protein
MAALQSFHDSHQEQGIIINEKNYVHVRKCNVSYKTIQDSECLSTLTYRPTTSCGKLDRCSQRFAVPYHGGTKIKDWCADATVQPQAILNRFPYLAEREIEEASQRDWLWPNGATAMT